MRHWVLHLILIMGCSFLGEAGAQTFGKHPGYTYDVPKERTTIDVEVVLVDPPKESAQLSQKIFDDRLTKEFRLRFEERFGVTSMEQSLNSPGRFDEHIYYGESVSLNEYRDEQRRFGEYMARRLTEHHADQWAKSKPEVRPLYELKDKVTNLNVTVKKGYKMRINYSLSGGHLDLRLENPYDIDTRLRIETSGGEDPGEVMLIMNSQITRLWSASLLFRNYDGLIQVVGSRYLGPGWYGTITGSSDSTNEGLNEKQDLFLLGMAWTN